MPNYNMRQADVLLNAEDIQDFDFESAKRDTISTKTQPGDLIIPAEMQGINPQLYDAVRAGLFMEGVDPNEFTAGHPMAKRNPITGEEHMFLNKIAKAVKKTVKKIVKNPIGRTLVNVGAGVLSGGNPYVIGAVNAATAKAAGASNTSALLQGAGAGFGAGLMKGAAGGKGMLTSKIPTGTVGNALTSTSSGFGSGITNALKSGALQATTALAGTGGLGTSLANNIMNTSMASLAGAQLGGSLGAMGGMMLSPVVQQIPDPSMASLQNAIPTVPTLASQQKTNLLGSGLGQNEALNYITTPQYQPFAGGALPGGTSYLSPMVNRYSGALGFSPSAFSDRVTEMSRRSGLTPMGGFGQGILYY